MHLRQRKNLAAALVFAAAFSVHIPSLQNGFVLWDDPSYVLDNLHIRSLNWALLYWSLTDLTSVVYWHPITWISHALDYAVWGLNPFGHHLTSLLVHGANASLVFLLFLRLIEAVRRRERRGALTDPSRQGAALVTAGVGAALFALHPLRVESVAWVSERKDLLCGLFYLSSLLVYLRYAAAEREADAERGARPFGAFANYLLSLCLFVLALASKPMAVSLPAVLLILDWYPLGRLKVVENRLRLAVEKVPFALGSLLVSAMSIRSHAAVGAISSLAAVPVGDRVAVSFRALVAYLMKFAAPLDLSPLYPYPSAAPFGSPRYLAPVLICTAVTVGCLASARRRPLWLSLWAYYVVTLLPVLGLVQVGYQSMADRFTYLPGLAPSLGVGLLAGQLWAKARGRVGRGALAGVGICAAVLLSFATIRQTGVWRDSLSLWNRVLDEAESPVPVAYLNRGDAYRDLGRAAEALVDYSAVIEAAPRSDLARKALARRGLLLGETGRPDLGLQDLDAAIRSDPSLAEAYVARGLLHERGMELDRAVGDYSAAIRLDPRPYVALTRRGAVFRLLGRPDRALADLDAALALRPDQADAYVHRGILFKEAGQFARALADYDTALSLDPNNAEAYNNRGTVYRRLGRLDRAVEEYTRAVSVAPGYALAFCNRGIALAESGRTEEAIADFTRALSLDASLARAYAERGAVYRRLGEGALAARDLRAACDLGDAQACEALRGAP